MHGSEQKALEVFDPVNSAYQNRFVWEDGVHAVRSVHAIHGVLQYRLLCNSVFTFPIIGFPIEEVRICGLPMVSCSHCLGGMS
jgi:hypothetical protein